MSRVEAAAAMDRLPWLPDEPKAEPARRRNGAALGWAAATIIIVAGAGFWMGTRSLDEQPATPRLSSQPTTTVPLPEARPVTPGVSLPSQAQVKPVAVPEVRPSPAREVRIAPPPVRRQATSEPEKTASVTADTTEPSTAPPAAAPAISAAQPFVPPKPWNPRIFD
jgi:hypothetical protein